MPRFLLVAFEVDEDSTVTEDELWVMGDQIATDMTEAGPLTYEGSHVVVRDQLGL